MPFDPEHPLNRGVVAGMRRRRPDAALTEVPKSGPDPYFNRGSHPDIVERIWKQLGASFPPEGRIILLGSPALIEPVRGVAVAVAWGTAYVLRVPDDAIETAIARGCATTHTWGNKSVTDVEAEFGRGWLFGRFVDEEPGWVARWAP